MAGIDLSKSKPVTQGEFEAFKATVDTFANDVTQAMHEVYRRVDVLAEKLQAIVTIITAEPKPIDDTPMDNDGV